MVFFARWTLIKPYRMEYDVKLPELGEGNMYIYWRARQTEPLIEEVKADDNLLINLGSMEPTTIIRLEKGRTICPCNNTGF